MNRTDAFVDETCAIWKPLIGGVRPRGKTQPYDLQHTIAAIFWRHEHGAKWRSITAELGPGWRAAQLFIRRAKPGVWERLLELVQEQQGVTFGMTFLDGTNVRATSRSGALSQPDTKKQQRRSSRSSPSLPQQTGSSSNRAYSVSSVKQDDD